MAPFLPLAPDVGVEHREPLGSALGGVSFPGLCQQEVLLGPGTLHVP